MDSYYVSCSGAAVFVKEAEFFKSQGGLTESWGKNWKGPISAGSIHDARMKGAELFKFRMSSAAEYLSATHEQSERRLRDTAPTRTDI